MIIRILNWLTGLHWSSSPHGMGCVHKRCQTWERCRAFGECEDAQRGTGSDDKQLETARETAEHAGDLHMLIGLLEKATGPSVSLNRAVWCALNPDQDPTTYNGDPRWRPYTTSIDAAQMLVPNGYDISITQASGPDRTDWYATCKKRDDWGSGTLHRGNACSGAIALCIAALKAAAALNIQQRAEK